MWNSLSDTEKASAVTAEVWKASGRESWSDARKIDEGLATIRRVKKKKAEQASGLGIMLLLLTSVKAISAQ